ncbi:MAG: TetR/AcrR family transcriptional regulator [Acidimicrobiia bacterium]|nr:TetR/AcrR family transcriptional regulator [Acidimicrobiia bacterium]MBV8303155.1 TetR/AcrR family transcriptional regulator [Acidimicrobiia bacterium]
MGRIAGVSAAETRERLLDAAARVFELKGYDGATVSLIAQEAGVTTGAIYAHYASKAELLAAALRAHGERATASLFPPGRRADAPTVLATLGARLAARDPHESALLVEALLAARRDPELADVLAVALADREALMAALVGRAQQRGELRADVSAAAAARFSLMLGLGSALSSSLGLGHGLPGVETSEWSTLIQRVVDAFTTEEKL